MTQNAQGNALSHILAPIIDPPARKLKLSRKVYHPERNTIPQVTSNRQQLTANS
ncbi:MAG: hypothetical protein IT425_13745 [Pirellulales bacterium]|nr:hypothetical protein [Pirellulales bacterium]